MNVGGSIWGSHPVKQDEIDLYSLKGKEYKILKEGNQFNLMLWNETKKEWSIVDTMTGREFMLRWLDQMTMIEQEEEVLYE